MLRTSSARTVFLECNIYFIKGIKQLLRKKPFLYILDLTKKNIERYFKKQARINTKPHTKVDDLGDRVIVLNGYFNGKKGNKEADCEIFRMGIPELLGFCPVQTGKAIIENFNLGIIKKPTFSS